MSDVTPVYSGAKPAKKTRGRLWWTIGSAVLVLCLAAAAAVIVPRVIHAQRVTSYNEFVALANTEIVETARLRQATEQTTVLYALQFAEATEFLPRLEKLAGMSDHYFTDADRADLTATSETPGAALAERALNDNETKQVQKAKETIETTGLIWQTDFLGLGIDAMLQLVEPSVPALVAPVPDEDVTQELVDEAEAQVAVEQGLRAEAESELARVEKRAASLIDAITATLQPLSNSATSAPPQVDVVLGMYPNAAPAAAETMRVSAGLAEASVAAMLFTQEDGVPILVVGEIPTDRATYPVTDALRAVIIAAHLEEYSDGITAAWITDAGGVEAALGFNPYLPLFF